MIGQSTEPVEQWVDHLFRRRAGQMISTLTRIFGPEQLDLVEDVVQEAFVTALRQWPFHGMPDNPSAWLTQVAKNRALDLLRRRTSWSAKQGEIERSIFRPLDPFSSAASQARFADEIRDDELRMVFMCCHPVLNQSARVALTLKMVGALSTSEIARAFLARESTVAQRLVRAKRKLRDEGVGFEMPGPEEMPVRLDSVLESLYLIFNEGHSAHEGEDLVRLELCQQAIRLVELVAAQPPRASLVETGAPRVHALASLFLFQGCRLPARTDGSGELLLLKEQDRSLWDRAMLARGFEHFEKSAAGDEVTRYHLQAEIASCHVLSESYEATDWPTMLAAYDQLLEIEPSPVVALNRAVALAQVNGPEAGLEALRAVEHEPALDNYHPFHASRGELLLRAGRAAEAHSAFRKALELSASAPVRRFLMRRLAEADRLGDKR